MIKTILSFFGYAKIPKAAIRLSIEQETYLTTVRDIFDRNTDAEFWEYADTHLRGQKTLTEFLRTGRLINED